MTGRADASGENGSKAKPLAPGRGAGERTVAGVSPLAVRPEVVAWAAAEALSRGGVLDVVTVLPPGSRVEPDPEVPRRAARLAAEAGPGLEIASRVVSGRPAETLCAESGGAGLLVVGADDQSPFAEAIIGSVPGALLTTAPCPLVIVPKGTRVPVPGPVLVGVDTAENSRPALDYAFDWAARTGRELRVLSCWLPARDRAERQLELQERRRALAIALAGFGERFPDVTVTELAGGEDPVEELSRHARRCGLLVLGTRARGRLASMTFGSVSRALLRRSVCPVAVIRPDPPAGTPVAANRVSTAARP